jgi:hypothetical protein
MNAIRENLELIFYGVDVSLNCNIPLLHTLSNLFFEDTCVQVIRVIILLVVLIMIMRYCGFDDMLFCCIYIDRCY